MEIGIVPISAVARQIPNPREFLVGFLGEGPVDFDHRNVVLRHFFDENGFLGNVGE